MSDTKTTNVVPFQRCGYEAKLVRFQASGFEFHIAGTLDGFIDLAIVRSDGSHLTYIITCDDARRLIAGLNTVVDDIQRNCLFDRDPFLVDNSHAE